MINAQVAKTRQNRVSRLLRDLAASARLREQISLLLTGQAE